MFTGLSDFLQVWRACKDKAAALHKCLSSLQSREGKRPSHADHKATKQLLHPALTCLSSLFSRGGALPLCTGKELLPRSRGSWLLREQRAQGEFVSLFRCTVLCLCCCLQFSDTHAWLPRLSSDLSFMRWAEYS